MGEWRQKSEVSVKGWSRGWIKLIASGSYIYTTHECVCLCTICPVVRKDKRKLIKKFLIRIFPLYIGLCSCVVARKLIIGSFLPFYPDSEVMTCSFFLRPEGGGGIAHFGLIYYYTHHPCKRLFRFLQGHAVPVRLARRTAVSHM